VDPHEFLHLVDELARVTTFHRANRGINGRHRRPVQHVGQNPLLLCVEPSVDLGLPRDIGTHLLGDGCLYLSVHARPSVGVGRRVHALPLLVQAPVELGTADRMLRWRPSAPSRVVDLPLPVRQLLAAEERIRLHLLRPSGACRVLRHSSPTLSNCRPSGCLTVGVRKTVAGG
jgi:hypothetical protein